ncbi:FMN-binding negative transcriptional regulator [Kordiimonas aestuarii]|uniref:FMN-binding negative transcriptional regulator n=1 Tax=Kordiimonas aestuarii TaxID=1005925 RepID=UPI0021CFC475|nr:FMN-binding negative transcriptional regulator [Kordiimonas aestuarii]
MAYPPKPHVEHDWGCITRLVADAPFAHIFSGAAGSQRVTRLPFVFDDHGDGTGTLRAHMDANNPQCAQLDGGDMLVAFSGPHAYVSPNWRGDRARGATWDYTAVHMWGRACIRQERAFFASLIRDLAAPPEHRYQALSEHPQWTLEDAPEAYVDRLFPHLTGFEIKVTRVEAISKVHQDFPPKDALLVADHLAQSQDEGGRLIAEVIREKTGVRGTRRSA